MDFQFVAKIIEQIEEATVQIDKNTITGSRLALILIDNAIEISMWKIIYSERSTEDFEAIIDGTFKDQYSDFRMKTKFLVSNKIITSDSKNIFDTCHHFRNEVYHKNIIKESIINDLAKIYLEAYCRVMFELLNSSFFITRCGESVPKILVKYGFKNDHIWLYREKIEEVVSIFLDDRLCSHRDFSQTLASDIKKRVNKVQEDINYIESFDKENIASRLETEKHALDSFLCRAYKLSYVLDVSNALTRYSRIDMDLIPIEYRMDYLAGMLSYELDLKYDQYKEDKYLETHDLQ